MHVFGRAGSSPVSARGSHSHVVHGARALEESPKLGEPSPIASSLKAKQEEYSDEYREMQEELEDLLAALGEESRKVDVLSNLLREHGVAVKVLHAFCALCGILT
jgi:Skp family chaperone for outer membrane proteins